MYYSTPIGKRIHQKNQNNQVLEMILNLNKIY